MPHSKNQLLALLSPLLMILQAPPDAAQAHLSAAFQTNILLLLLYLQLLCAYSFSDLGCAAPRVRAATLGTLIYFDDVMAFVLAVFDTVLAEVFGFA